MKTKTKKLCNHNWQVVEINKKTRLKCFDCGELWNSRETSYIKRNKIDKNKTMKIQGLSNSIRRNR